MSDVSIHCPCGNRLFGGVDANPALAHVIEDSAWLSSFSLLAAKWRDYTLACNGGKRTEWLYTEFSAAATLESSDAEVLEVLVERLVRPEARELWSCGKCGRRFLEHSPGRFEYETVVPEAAERGRGQG